MIRIDRKTGKVIHMDPVSPEDLDRAWNAVVQDYAPRVLKQYFPQLDSEKRTGGEQK